MAMKAYVMYLPKNKSKGDVKAGIRVIGAIHFSEPEITPIKDGDGREFVRVALEADSQGSYDRLFKNLGALWQD